MSRQLVIDPEAESEMKEAVMWYEDRRPGLGAAFRLAVEARFGEIQRNPKAYPVVHKTVRRALLRRFPYGIMYVFNDARIDIVSVFHAKRDPKHWQSRT